MMTTTETTKEEAFIDRIEHLDTGQLAMLRRGCGERGPIEGRCPWLMGLIRGVAHESVAFLVASLLAQYKTTDIKAHRHRMNGSFGLTWKRATLARGSDSLERRFHILLDADFDPWAGDGDLPHRLRQMVRYAAREGVGVDWPLLLKHLRAWQSETKWVQKEWARDFHTDKHSEDTEKQHNSEE